MGLTTKVSCSSGAAGKVDPGCAGGCFLLSWIRELSSGVHKDSAELAKRTAPLKSPSSSLAETLTARLLGEACFGPASLVSLRVGQPRLEWPD